MNWIDFKKERPKEEPVRRIVVHFESGVMDMISAGSYALERNDITHWSEIEPPQEPEPHPYPVDPVEVAWKEYQSADYSDMETAEFHFHKGWDAAIKWKEGQK